MKKTLCIMSIAAALAAGACSDKLDIAQHGNISTKEEYYKTDDEVESAVAAMYLQLKNVHFQFFYTLTSLDGDTWTGGMARGDNSNMEKLCEYTYDASHEWLKNCYVNFYEIIYKASLITDNVTGDTDVKARAVEEAKVMRAFVNFYLVNMWGNAPLVDHVLSPDEYHVTNSTPAEFWASIEADFTEAISSGKLPSKSGVTDRETGIRITKEFAYAMLGKAYLWQGKWAQAVEAFDEVINSGLYGLYGVAEEGEYEDIMHAVANNCCESLFEAQWRKDASQAWSQANTLFCSLGLRDSYFDITNETIALGGWGFINPTKDLYDAFVAEEGEDGYRLRGTIRTNKTLAEDGIVMKSATLPGCEGYFDWKYRMLKDDLVYDNQSFQVLQYCNFRFMRYAEVLLCAAEAALQAGDQTKADGYVNQVRRRARLADKAGVTLTDIKTEKRLELCMENVRWLDLLRWGDAPTVLAEQGHYVPSYTYDAATGTETIDPDSFVNTTYGFKDKHKLLPIPANEVQVNPNITQNPGW